jgi:hypothetical protein
VGRPHKGAFDLAKLEPPKAFGAPQWSNLTTRGFFAPVSRTAFGNNQKFMKPTPQISPNQHASRSFPLTDCSFQPTVEAQTSSSAVLPATKAPAFHKLSSEFFGAETSRDYIAELLFFTVITGISAWPIISMIVAVTRLVRNY